MRCLYALLSSFSKKVVQYTRELANPNTGALSARRFIVIVMVFLFPGFDEKFLSLTQIIPRDSF